MPSLLMLSKTSIWVFLRLNYILIQLFSSILQDDDILANFFTFHVYRRKCKNVKRSMLGNKFTKLWGYYILGGGIQTYCWKRCAVKRIDRIGNENILYDLKKVEKGHTLVNRKINLIWLVFTISIFLSRRSDSQLSNRGALEV